MAKKAKSVEEIRAILAGRKELCSDGCRGWAVFRTNTRRGFEIEICDECRSLNNLDITDDDVERLPEAQQAIQGVLKQQSRHARREFGEGAHDQMEKMRKKLKERHTKLRENPPWVTRVLTDHWDQVASGVPATWMPKLAEVHAGARGKTLVAALTEYGCGAYGCVLPTNDDKIVLKVTTDSTEAEFASDLADTLIVPVTVAYPQTADLPDDQHDGRTVHLLWREEAKEVGAIAKQKSYGKKARDLIHAQHKAAQDAFSAIHEQREFRPLLERWREASRKMSSLPELAYLADGMRRVLDEQSIFFGDVHEGNLGLADRDGTPQWVITDPGHVAVVA